MKAFTKNPFTPSASSKDTSLVGARGSPRPYSDVMLTASVTVCGGWGECPGAPYTPFKRVLPFIKVPYLFLQQAAHLVPVWQQCSPRQGFYWACMYWVVVLLRTAGTWHTCDYHPGTLAA